MSSMKILRFRKVFRPAAEVHTGAEEMLLNDMVVGK